MPEQRKRRSYSQLKSWASCGKAYELERVVKAPSRPAAWFSHGTAFHAAVEAYERSQRRLSPDECIAAFEAAWAESIMRDYERQPDLSVWMTGGRRKPETDIETRYAEGKSQVLAYLDYVSESGETIWTAPDGRLAIELEIQFVLSDIPVIVYIDQVIITSNGRLVVRDLKTGSSYNSPLQLATYDLALEAEYGLRAGWGDFWLAKKSKPDNPVDLHPYTAERVGAWYAQMDAGVSAGIYVPSPTDRCRNMCGVSQWCTAVGGVDYYPNSL
ncbi:RecB family exonuclease [Kitasatospora acidiphila]|uniref:RecB family exonuclease n=1 Tax=Kitasatospora acidiphila TaxID=2567942 RepID=UPI0015F03BA2|nr:PD-(D/E)XK nuclease family protein [Kitasatospora acidiphila]